MMTMAFGVSFAQSSSSDYFVKTRNVKPAADTPSESGAVEGVVTPKRKRARDFISENFPYESLCSWRPGMKFMVLPDKYDLIVKTFTNVADDREVSSMSLRTHIMSYQGYEEGSDGHDRVLFDDLSNGNQYYYEIPNGTFKDYCDGKLGIPTLAYLGDVDIAREKLMEKTLITKTNIYRIDVDAKSDKYEEVKVKPNEEVTVVGIGVGTRSFPVKIIVADKSGNEFYQNVAISRTNSGMRDDEFVDGDNARFSFAGSFEMQDAMMELRDNISEYIGEIVHNKVKTSMQTKGDGKDRTLDVPAMLSFKIEAAQLHEDGYTATLTLEQTDTRRIFNKTVIFRDYDEALGDRYGQKSDYFAYVFAMNEGKEFETTPQARAAIREGRVIIGMSEDEVLLAMAGPDNRETDKSGNGQYSWFYNRSQGKRLWVKFGPTGKVINVEVISPGKGKSTTSSNNRNTGRTRQSAKDNRMEDALLQ